MRTVGTYFRRGNKIPLCHVTFFRHASLAENPVAFAAKLPAVEGLSLFEFPSSVFLCWSVCFLLHSISFHQSWRADVQQLQSCFSSDGLPLLCIEYSELLFKKWRPAFENYLTETVGRMYDPPISFRLVPADYTANETSENLVKSGAVDFMCECFLFFRFGDSMLPQ